MTESELDKLIYLIRLVVEKELNEGPSNRHNWEIDNEFSALKKELLQ